MSKFYWLKLKRDFFKRHDIRIIESMPNGKDYILFYLKLLCESVDHEGNLRFSDEIPYNESMLATITDTNPDIVKTAIDVFIQLGMMDVLDDGTYFMNEVNKMMGSCADNDNANRQRRFRERKKVALLECYESVTERNESKSIEKEKDKEIDKDKKNTSRFTPPSVDEVRAYCQERGNNIDPQYFVDYYEGNGWTRGKSAVKIKDWKACVRTWEKNNYNKKEKPKNKFDNFEGRKYDAKELERKLLGG